MKRSITTGALGVLLAVAASGALGQTTDPGRLRINGVGLESTYAQVIKALGKPVKDGKATHEECIGGHEKTVDYAGLKIYLMDEGEKVFKVEGLTVTSSHWLVSGIRVGVRPAAVKAKFGTKYTVNRRTDNGGLVWQYDFDGGEGTTTVIFKGGKVTEISTAFQVC
jgi:hypothetical protein